MQHPTKSLSYKCNQQVINGNNTISSSLISTSETKRAISNWQIKDETLFNQWLAGLIDGDGSLQVSKAGYSSCEITVALADESMLLYIQSRAGGTIKKRFGVQAVRWRLQNRQGMLALVNRINGYIRHSSRLEQLKRVCILLDIKILNPDLLHNQHGWFAGFFDVDGTIGYYFKGAGANNRPQLTLSVTNKLYSDIVYFSTIFGGEIYFDRSQNGYYKWSIQSEANFKPFLEYIKMCPPKSIKYNRMLLVKEYYDLIQLKAYKAPEGTELHKAWADFNQKWNDA